MSLTRVALISRILRASTRQCAPRAHTRSRHMATHHFLFSGQGSQRVGMTRKVTHLPAVQEIFSTAARVLGYDLQAVCLRGPPSTLDETVHCQPAVVVASLAAVEVLREDSPEAIANCCSTGGFSVGELTALIFAGALSLEEGLHLIRIRAEAMNESCLENKGSMATIIGIQEETLSEFCEQAKQSGLGEACIANCIFPKGSVISGNTAAVDFVTDKAQKCGGSVKAVAVSGAFHSPLMASAVPKLQAALEKVVVSTPRVPVYSNVTGLPYKTVDEIKTNLAAQVVKPVLWEVSIRNMIVDHSGATFVELGPGRQLKAMLRRINKDAFKSCTNVDV